MASNLDAKVEAERFILLPIDPTVDYPTLTNVSILSFLRNPLHYLTFPPTVAHDDIVAYHGRTIIEYRYEGKEIQTVKIVDTSSPDRPIVAFGIWRFGKVREEREPRRPEGSDFGFVENYRKRMAPIADRIYDSEKDIGVCLPFKLSHLPKRM